MSLFDRSQQGNVISPALNSSGVDLGAIPYSNPRLPPAFNGDAENAMNYLFAAIYPNYIATVATPAALPVSASPNDYYIVADDGDGKSAGYVWIVRDNAGGFEKKYDVDWSMEGIYAETIARTQYLYVSKLGMTDKDAAGNDVVGLYAGQTVYGGDQTSQNLTFNANSKDSSGFIQTDNTFRPTASGSIDLGTSALKFRSGYFSTSVLVGNLTLGSGSIVDSSGSLSFGSTNLSTTGTLSAGAITGTSLTLGTISLSAGSITDSGGTINFGSTNLTTTGTVAANGFSGGSSTFGDITISTGSIVASGGAISFAANDLTTTGNVTAGRVNVDNLRLDANTLSAQNANGNVSILANGTGVIDLQSAATTLDISSTGNISATGTVTGGNLSLSTNSLISTNANGNIILAPNGTGIIQASSNLNPTSDATVSLGDTTHRFITLYLSSGISDGTNTITQSTLLSLRDINVGVAAGMAIFYDGSKWVASAPDTEITHNTLSGLTTGDAGHTQFVMLAGRSGGQTVQGGTAASDNLVFESTSNGSKGLVLTKDVFAPFTNASYSSGWLGTDLGDSSHIFRDVYTKGEFQGLRFQNVSAAPSSSPQNIGRAVYNTSTNRLLVDTGSAFVAVGATEKFSGDQSFDGVVTTKDVDVSASVTDARTAVWQLLDNANDFERIYTVITATSATNVRIITNVALPAGTYRLVGLN